MSRNAKSDKETVSFGVRIPKDDREWLEATARANGVEVSQLVRWSIEALRQYIMEHDGKLHLPINIRDFWQVVQKHLPAPAEPLKALRAADAADLPANTQTGTPQTGSYIPPRKRSTGK